MGARGSKLSRVFLSFRRPKLLLHHKPPVAPKGYVPVYVGLGNESKRFMIHTTLFGEEDLMELLCKSEEEYGFDNQGVIKIPYDAKRFEERMLMRDKHKSFRLLITA